MARKKKTIHAPIVAAGDGFESYAQLIDVLREMKDNTRAWAVFWIKDGIPPEAYPQEHHVITEALAGFRARLLASGAALLAEVQEKFKDVGIMEGT